MQRVIYLQRCKKFGFCNDCRLAPRARLPSSLHLDGGSSGLLATLSRGSLANRVLVLHHEPPQEKSPLIYSVGFFACFSKLRYFTSPETLLFVASHGSFSTNFASQNWLPRLGSNQGHRGYNLTPIARRVGLSLRHDQAFRPILGGGCKVSALSRTALGAG